MATKTKKPASKAPKPGPSEQAALAAKAQAKGQPASRITSTNIECCQKKLGGDLPSKTLGLSANTLAQIASGKKQKSSLPKEQRIALRDFGSALGAATFYGRKLAAMLWAIETGGGAR